ncbi:MULTISPECIES: hypothetical protein [unclassified Methylopila]|uniref:hypothetical protein n=1 Tax=unclassified Methylopila TaxID=2628841 RepID=UPI00037EB409|nr:MULTISPECIES: hypothetical protein [unclassified Methylopila]GBD46894.1 hypothetical protein METY_0107 [Methylopila sp. Yamaguchi]
MFRKFVLAAALAAGGFAAVPTAASAGDVSVRVGVGSPGYYGGGYYEPAYHRGYRHRYRERPYYGYYAPRPRYYGYGPARPRCRVTTVRSWNGYRYVTRTREVCGRRYY